jgi:hypothetical protein
LRDGRRRLRRHKLDCALRLILLQESLLRLLKLPQELLPRVVQCWRLLLLVLVLHQSRRI